ncbi:MAG: bile acid:sodium symporter [Opitutaceae bacterium]|nr:bile acid:sodium symporter [Opitutaceae bacterium]
MRLKVDWFLGGMAAAVALAWIFPDPGARGGWLYPEILTKAGIALIFLLHGLTLSFASLKAGTVQWRLHLVVQITTFLVFPLIGLATLWAVGGRLSPALRTGVFFLCALPSTVSSSVAMTAVARGNVAGAVFNATLSSLIGIFVTPLWIGLLLTTGGQRLRLGTVILDLIIWLLLPLVLGQCLRPFLGELAARYRRYISLVDRLTILLLVYTSFCDSMKQGVWTNQGAGMIAGIALGSCALFALVMSLVNAVSRALHFSEEDRIAAIFCGSKKTLASGVPMAQLIFGSHPGIGLILLPIMVYHQLQLIICASLAGKWGGRSSNSGS